MKQTKKNYCVDCNKEICKISTRCKSCSNRNRRGKYKEETKRKISLANSKEKHPKWKGGRYLSKQGYILILKPNHPKASERGYIYEHILVMEEYLKRQLKPSEIIHHINQITTDNRIENLQITNRSKHMSNHKTKWWREIKLSQQ